MKTPRESLQLSLQGFEQPVARLREAAPRRTPNSDLIGCVFFDGTSDVRVCNVAATNPAHVVVERERDGYTWTIHAGIIRLIVGRTRRKRAA
jgi:hypothetical protein